MHKYDKNSFFCAGVATCIEMGEGRILVLRLATYRARYLDLRIDLKIARTLPPSLHYWFFLVFVDLVVGEGIPDASAPVTAGTSTAQSLLSNKKVICFPSGVHFISEGIAD